MELHEVIEKKKRSCRIYITVCHNGTKKQFDPKLSCPIETVVNDLPKGIKMAIREAKDLLEQLYIECDKSSDMTAKELVDYFNSRIYQQKVRVPDFYKYATKVAAAFTEQGKRRGNDIMIVVRSLQDFKKGTLHFNQIDIPFISSYKQYVCMQHKTIRKDQFGIERTIIREGISEETFNDRLRIMRSIINKAKREYNIDSCVVVDQIFHLCRVNRPLPCRHDRILPIDILRRLLDMKPETEKQRMTRSLFLFSLFTCGLNAKDMYEMPMNALKGSYLTYNRSKTKEKRADKAKISVEIPDVVFELIKPYLSKEGQFLFKMKDLYSSLSNFQHALSDGLSQIRRIWKYDGTLQFYGARHTFANIAHYDLGIDKSFVALCLNHKLPAGTTSLYINVDPTIIWQVQKKVLAFVMESRKSLVA